MLLSIILATLLLSSSYADYTIRTRQDDNKEILTPTSPMVITTISSPPYMSTFLNGSDGLVPDVLKVLQEAGVLSTKFDLRVSKKPTPGLLGKNTWTGIVQDARQKYAHFAVGPIYDNIFLTEEEIYFSQSWFEPQLALVVRLDSPLAQLFRPTTSGSNELNLDDVHFIIVEQSAEYQYLTDSRIYNEENTYIQDKIQKSSPIMVNNVCDGFKYLGAIDDNDDPVDSVKAMKSKPTQNQNLALLLNSIEASHFASGNEVLITLLPQHLPGILSGLGKFSFMSNTIFHKMSTEVGNAIDKNRNKINKIVTRWSQYDKDACKRLRIAISGSGNISINKIVLVFAAFVAVLPMVPMVKKKELQY